MKYLIFADSHGYAEKIFEIIPKIKADKIILLGDIGSSVQDLRRDFFNCSICYVYGNNDYDPNELEESILCDGPYRLLLTHGHKYGVKMSFDGLIASAKRQDCDIVLFGHTHIELNERKSDILLINPGSITFSRTYAILNINNNLVDVSIQTVDE